MTNKIYKPFRRILAIALALSLSAFGRMAFAEHLEVYRWESLSYAPNALIASMMKAAKIHEKQGAHVGIFQMDVGSAGKPSFDYVLRWDNAEAWAKTKSLNGNEDWQAFWTEASASPSGNLLWSLEGINLDRSVPAAHFKNHGPYRVYIWKPTAGEQGRMMTAFNQAKALHNSLGADVHIYSEGVGGSGNIHYVLLFDDWTELASFGDGLVGNQEWLALQASASGSATLLGSIQGIPLYSSE